jgi:hypothetical protein
MVEEDKEEIEQENILRTGYKMNTRIGNGTER